MTNRVLCTLGLLTILTGVLVGAAHAEEPSTWPPFGKEPGSIYLGGTAGLSGIDSVRGFTDSVFYAKWAAQAFVEMVGGPSGVIYGDDNRLDIYTLSDPNLLKLAQAAFVVAFGSEVSDNGDGTYDLVAYPWTTQGGLPLCQGERFVGQLQMGNCSGFLVGEDLVVTAGHCISSCGTWAFVFGFQQTDSLTAPITTVSADDVYFCSEIVDRVQSGDLDHCLIRLDRPVVGRTPIPIRRSGTVPNGAPLVVMGHPTVLPMKAAAGAEVKNNQGTTPWFQANLDTYGGNSGSMVVNTDTWEIEGILVRGAPDFVYTSCAASNEVPNTGNTGGGLVFEEVSKVESFAHLIPALVNSTGEVTLDRLTYNCDDQIGVELADLDLASLGAYDVLLFTSAADSELVSSTETGVGTGLFEGSITTLSGTIVKYDGLLQVSDGDQITAQYEDADDGSGNPATVQDNADIDCQTPVITSVSIVNVTATTVTVAFTTDEAAQGRAWVGSTCGTYDFSRLGPTVTNHEITVGSLSQNTPYLLMVEATDPAGNQSQDDNAGACYAFSTPDAPDYFTEVFSDGCDLEGKTIRFLPNGSADFYEACRFDETSAWIETGAATTLGLTDDDYVAVSAGGGNLVPIYGTGYATVQVGSNGFVTFGEGNTDYSETLDEHFAAPPRISAYWDDLDPTSGGRISYEQQADRLVVSWEDVPEYSGANTISVQLQLFFAGSIVMCYRTVQPLDGLVGLSAGTGYPVDFIPSDLSSYAGCALITCYTDSDGDGFGADDDPGHAESGPLCSAGSSDNNLDCDDISAAINPDGVEILDDGIDQDCDGFDASCCSGKVGDVNGLGGDVPTIGDISKMVDHLFLSEDPLDCYQEGDINQSGGRYPTPGDITIGDVSTLVDHLFISNPELNDCL